MLDYELLLWTNTYCSYTTIVQLTWFGQRMLIIFSLHDIQKELEWTKLPAVTVPEAAH